MQKLSSTDLNFILRRIPKDVRDLVKKAQLFIAGGVIRSVIAGEKINDIDIFGQSKELLTLSAENIALYRAAKVHRTDNAITVVSGAGRIPLQFITKWLYLPADAERLLAEFDFTICQAVIWWEGNGWTSAISDRFYQDLAARRLVYTYPDREEAAGGSLLRFRKFLGRGYNIQVDSLAGVISRLVSGIKEEAMPVDEHTPRGIEKARARVMTGLLREVDPLLVVDGCDVIDEHEPVEGEQP